MIGVDNITQGDIRGTLGGFGGTGPPRCGALDGKARFNGSPAQSETRTNTLNVNVFEGFHKKNTKNNIPLHDFRQKLAIS